MNADWGRIEEIFQEAIALPAAERVPFVRRVCDGDEGLAREVTEYLRSHDEAEEFLERPAIEWHAAEFAGESEESETLPAGTSLGEYRIVSLLGLGGMGEVYLAEDPALGRRVAIKLVRRGLGSAGSVRHLRREARILAGLNDPHIARLYGVAVTSEGVPYFVMEYVAGERLDHYCRENRLTTNEIVALFRKVCSAVSFAHRHLVIHRDLKPANIRVTPEGEPKLLDFGVAKLLDAEFDLTSQQTLTLSGMMTPDYASPEQIRGETMSTASDVYSLGVLLYELLTEERPHRLTTRNPQATARAITESEPSRPSSHRAALAGDLDNILLMALRKEPERRYPSVGQFSEDLLRYLSGRPVTARKDTWSYRSAKFLRRHRVAVAAAALVLLTLLGGTFVTWREERAAQREKVRAKRISAFLEELLNYSNPYLIPPSQDGRITTVNELLDVAAARLDHGAFADQPAVRAELERIIGDSYYGQGKPHLGTQHLEKFIQFQRKTYGPNDPRAILAEETQAMLLFGQGKIATAEKLYRQLLPEMRARQKKGEISADALSGALCDLAYIRRTVGDSREAESLFREVLALGPQLSPGRRYLLGITQSTLASTLADEGKFSEALQTAEEAVRQERAAGTATMPSYGFSLNILGGFLVDEKDFVRADAVLGEGENLLRKLLSSSHLWLGDNLRNQAISFYEQGRLAEAKKKDDEAIKIYLDSFGPNYDNYPTALLTRGLILSKEGQPAAGEELLRRAVKMRTDSLPSNHFWVAAAKGALGECLASEGRYAEAEPLLQDSYDVLKMRFGSDDPRTRGAAIRLKDLYQRWNRPEKTIQNHSAS